MILSYRRFRRSRSRYLLYLAVFLLLVDAVNQLVQRPPTRRQHIPPNRGPNQTTVFIASVHGPPAGTSAVLSEAAARGTDGRRIVGKGHQNDVFAGEGGGPNGMKVSRHAWNDAVLRLVAYLGPENVHFSAVEAGTAGREPETQEALLELRAELDRLHASNTIRVNVTDWDVLDQELDDAERQTDPPEHRRPGWIWDREMKRMQMRRIPYMAELRNLALEPMERDDRRFDYILWLNDALFDTQDVVTLMHTRDGDYAAACSMDFATSSRYHDSLALRDSQGQRTASSYFPWFHSPASLVAVRRGDPVPVASCWNGLVVFDAAPFYPDFSLHDGKTHVDGRRDGAGGGGAAAMMLTDEHERHAALAKRDDKLDRFDRDHDSIELPEQQASSRQKEQQQHRHRALRFRAIPDSLAEHRLEGSERCLIHFDNPLSASRGVWLNPSVRVAYSVSTYISVRRLLGAPDARDFPGAIATIVGAWVNRWQRWHGGVALALDRWTVRRRVARWMADGDRLGGEESARREIGEVCLVADMLALRKRPPALEP